MRDLRDFEPRRGAAAAIHRNQPLRRALAALAGAAAFVCAGPASAELPPLSASDWAAAAPAADPRATMIVLFRSAEVQLRDLGQGQASSSLRPEQRLKILTAEGLHGGELEIAHSRSLRLKSLTGRTVFADGRVVPLPADAKDRKSVV